MSGGSVIPCKWLEERLLPLVVQFGLDHQVGNLFKQVKIRTHVTIAGILLHPICNTLQLMSRQL